GVSNLRRDSVQHFKGCKLVVHCNEQIITYKRDNISSISYPNCWDLPGGGREGNETPEDCALRELKEEFGIELCPSRIHYKQKVESHTGFGYAYFLAVTITESELREIQFGDEGQYWKLMDIETYLALPDAVPSNQQRIKGYLNL
ncbi:NUDIX hydrolase, partial [Vibrio vulnificus]|uniref:NUDIX hydrolase n=1 Tax=Vibrio vulnificus TaxID=672 RepID=UPI003EDA2607